MALHDPDYINKMQSTLGSAGQRSVLDVRGKGLSGNLVDQNVRSGPTAPDYLKPITEYRLISSPRIFPQWTAYATCNPPLWPSVVNPIGRRPPLSQCPHFTSI
ncbi:hypothetical protein EVAR_4255_1 [Eumeta japonica]|uniref:Uncharacterized protein n=1 Tax=Eumeta variegata TaxID=151549 RepID=A0A4C1Z4M5_EUMVA|nr:hypothetical protein EVAR_4255_1 [Eumeta japonica]